MKHGSNDMASTLKAKLEAEAAATKKGSATGRLMVYLDPGLYEQFRLFCAERGLTMTRAATIAIETLMENA